MATTIDFAPFVSLAALWALAAVALLLTAYALFRRARGAWARALAFAATIAVLADPLIVHEQRQPLTDVAVIVTDVPQGATAEQAAPLIKLFMILDDISFRNLIPAELAKILVDMLGLNESVVPVLATSPMRGGLPTAVPTDPTIYRFYEALQVYGGALKELIHEQFGDGIMSAINFSIDMQKKPHPSGDRVVVTFDGKFLPYQWITAEQ